ncbi:hypothetical protein [Phenylobacterium sp. J367]|uniref:hypothetical protein n=1 Tax=Phenylobacterium sp. J367 TaxID=2898435 RepID=UPI00215130F0|nr:hypothetical protein [Phenylobacterium sp. J367]MCR5877740.1 hypothetical protein [Phenylobacterium sp. J367]
MRHFITLIVPSDGVVALDAVMTRHGRRAQPMDNPSVREVLLDGERQYLTTAGPCDCGTVLGVTPVAAEELENDLAREAARLTRKGWSAAKIARALDDRRRADARPKGRDGPDSLDLWTEVLAGLRDGLKLPYAGLLVHAYRGGLEDEIISATRRAVGRGIPHPEGLAALVEDEVTIFPLR